MTEHKSKTKYEQLIEKYPDQDKRYLRELAGIPYGLNEQDLDNFPNTAYIIDIDGTVALRDDEWRTPYEWNKAWRDIPNTPVIRVVKALFESDPYVHFLFVSGRSNECYMDTWEWIKQNVISERLDLHMRTVEEAKAGISDVEVKTRIMDDYIVDKYKVLGVFDDRQGVVDLYREKYGFTVFQVAPGNSEEIVMAIPQNILDLVASIRKFTDLPEPTICHINEADYYIDWTPNNKAKCYFSLSVDSNDLVEVFAMRPSLYHDNYTYIYGDLRFDEALQTMISLFNKSMSQLDSKP